MPQYLTRKDNTFYFRQAVPVELRSILGRREIKKSLGRNYEHAVRACKRYAVEADNLLADARARLDAASTDPYSWDNIRRTKRVVLTRLTPELETQFGTLIRNGLLETDQNKRIEGMNRDEFEEYGQHIEAGLKALRRQLAMGNVEPMMSSAQLFVFGRGYEPRLDEGAWRRLAYVMTQANLEAYELMAARQAGGIVKPDEAPVLASQYEVQHAERVAAAKTTVTWNDLFDTWAGECERRDKTRDAYQAAMRLFIEHSGKMPQAVTREDALAFKEYLLQPEHKLDVGTVANKIGFVGTLINAGRNNSKYAKYLPYNPFADIKVKRAKRGKAGKKRLPFSDAELKKIFSSSIYTQGIRPRGGAGEAAAWIPAIAYLTGMNLEEIALLKASQFHVDAQGNPYIHTEDGKTENRADRDVPLHPMLIEAGLLDYVKSCNGRLFPKVHCANEAQSAAYSKWYGRFLDKLGITAKSKVFHSFRHLFKDLCRNVGLDDSAIDQICGHEPGTVGGKYGIGRRTDVMAELIAKVRPPVALPRITPPPGI